MTRIASLVLSIFLTLGIAHASQQDNPDGRGPRIQVYTNDAHGRTVRIPTQDDVNDMRTCIQRFEEEYARAWRGQTRAVFSEEALLRVTRKFADEILMNPFRQLRGMAYAVLYTKAMDPNNFALAFNYALDEQSDRADQLYQHCQRFYQVAAEQSSKLRQHSKRNAVNLKVAADTSLKRIDEIVKEERARHQQRVAQPNNPEHDHHPLEVRRLKQMESDQMRRTLSLVPGAIVNAGKIALFVLFVYMLACKIV